MTLFFLLPFLIVVQVVGPADGSAYVMDYYAPTLIKASIDNETYYVPQDVLTWQNQDLYIFYSPRYLLINIYMFVTRCISLSKNIQIIALVCGSVHGVGTTFVTYQNWETVLQFQPSINPILTGRVDPPCTKSATAADCDAPFHEFFLSSLTHLLIPSLQKSDHRSWGHVTFCTRTSAQNLPKICILHICLFTKTHGNYWFS